MDTRLYRRLSKRLPDFNEEIINGLAYYELKPEKAIQYLSDIFRCASESFPEGFEFHGIERCSPLEEYRITTNRKSGNRNTYDIARSDLYMIKYTCSFNGVKRVVHHLLPFARKGGVFYLSDKLCSISAVLTDKMFSVNDSEIYMPLTRAKVNFSRTIQTYVKDGAYASSYVTWSWIHNLGGRIKIGTNEPTLIRPNKMYSTAMHYVFCKHGVLGAFEKYLGFKPIVMEECEYLANESQYPKEDYAVYRSLRERPVEYVGDDYINNQCMTWFIVPRDKVSSLVDSFIAGFYYTADRIPSKVNSTNLDDPTLWHVMLGYILFGDFTIYGKMMVSIQEHMDSIASYIDFRVKSKLMKYVEDMPASLDHLNNIDDIYDLLVYIVDRQTPMLMQGSLRPGNLYNKQLEILHYVLYDLHASIIGLSFALNNGRTATQEANSVFRILDENIRTRAIFALNSSNKEHRHGEISSVSSPSDNMYFKITSMVIHQMDAVNHGSREDVAVDDPINHIDSSFSEVTGYNVLPKRTPLGNSRLNPWVNLRSDGSIKRNQDLKAIVDKAQNKICTN